MTSATLEPETVVIFRRWRNGDIVAIFPEIPHDNAGHYCLSYEHVGQHGACSVGLVGAHTTLATPDEYASLARELESRGMNMGYRLKIRKRCTSAHYRTLRASLASETAPA